MSSLRRCSDVRTIVSFLTEGIGVSNEPVIASASLKSSRILPSADFIKRTRNPDLVPPAKIERTPYVEGSRRLVLGKWVEDVCPS